MHSVLTIATAKYTWAWLGSLDTADMIEIALVQDSKVSCYTQTIHSLSINIGHDKEQPIRRKNTLLTAVACVGVVSYVRMETYKCIKFNVTVTVKALVT